MGVGQRALGRGRERAAANARAEEFGDRRRRTHAQEARLGLVLDSREVLVVERREVDREVGRVRALDRPRRRASLGVREELLRARLVRAELRRDVVRLKVSAVADAANRRAEVLAAKVVEHGLAVPARTPTAHA